MFFFNWSVLFSRNFRPACFLSAAYFAEDQWDVRVWRRSHNEVEHSQPQGWSSCEVHHKSDTAEGKWVWRKKIWCSGETQHYKFEDEWPDQVQPQWEFLNFFWAGEKLVNSVRRWGFWESLNPADNSHSPGQASPPAQPGDFMLTANL